MFKSSRPEAIGISSRDVYNFLSSLEKRGAHLHSMLLMRGDKIFLEAYWKPFNKDFNHRMYSATKSLVSVAIGLCLEDGLIDLDSPIASYFPDKIEGQTGSFLESQTIREMLTMTTTGQVPSWFTLGATDRTHFYFSNMNEHHPAGTLWDYDSAGSQVLSSLVEKVTGKALFDFLSERIFCHLGCFKNAKILKTPNGDSWGDSAMICTSRDLAAFARFVMNYGVWNGKRLMGEEYLRLATSNVVCNRQSGHNDIFEEGYGYQFWKTEDDGFVFRGMGDQLAICMPKQDLILVCTADNQGNPFISQYIAAQFMDLIVAKAADAPLEQNDFDYEKLQNLSQNLELFAVSGAPDSPLREKINGVVYECSQNPMGWKQFSLHFDSADKGKLCYINERGEMAIDFFVNRNLFGIFPDKPNYRDAVSLAWTQENKILIFVQIIDEFFGNCSINIAFKDDFAAIKLSKHAENFLCDYCGEAISKQVK